MALNNLRDYFRMRCSDMLKAEQDIEDLNNIMASEVKNADLKNLLQQHSQPIQQHIKSLETVLNKMGGPATAEGEGFFEKVAENIGVSNVKGTPFTQAAMRDHDAFKKTDPSQQLVDINDCVEADSLAHFEIAGYTGLIVMAKQLGDMETASLFQQDIDNDTQWRMQLDKTLPMLVSQTGGEGKMAA